MLRLVKYVILTLLIIPSTNISAEDTIEYSYYAYCYLPGYDLSCDFDAQTNKSIPFFINDDNSVEGSGSYTVIFDCVDCTDCSWDGTAICDATITGFKSDNLLNITYEESCSESHTVCIRDYCFPFGWSDYITTTDLTFAYEDGYTIEESCGEKDDEVDCSTCTQKWILHRASSSSTTTTAPPHCDVDPPSGAPGQTIEVTITSLNSSFIEDLTRVTFSCLGININSTSVISPTEVVIEITIDKGAPEGDCDLTLRTGDEYVTCDGAFTVTRSPITTTSTTTTIICELEAIYGKDSNEIKILRRFRDEMLAHNPEGQEIIRLYYEWSPAIVKVMEGDEEFKQWMKDATDRVLPLIEDAIK